MIDQKREQIIRDGNEAKALIEHPMIRGFVEKYEKVMFYRFMSLDPKDVKMQDYSSLHHQAIAVRQLLNHLQEYVDKKTSLLERRLDEFSNVKSKI